MKRHITCIIKIIMNEDFEKQLQDATFYNQSNPVFDSQKPESHLKNERKKDLLMLSIVGICVLLSVVIFLYAKKEKPSPTEIDTGIVNEQNIRQIR